jgi:hypothetical protein
LDSASHIIHVADLFHTSGSLVRVDCLDWSPGLPCSQRWAASVDIVLAATV